jgi:hypothetical protein
MGFSDTFQAWMHEYNARAYGRAAEGSAVGSTRRTDFEAKQQAELQKAGALWAQSDARYTQGAQQVRDALQRGLSTPTFNLFGTGFIDQLNEGLLERMILNLDPLTLAEREEAFSRPGIARLQPGANLDRRGNQDVNALERIGLLVFATGRGTDAALDYQRRTAMAAELRAQGVRTLVQRPPTAPPAPDFSNQ